VIPSRNTQSVVTSADHRDAQYTHESNIKSEERKHYIKNGKGSHMDAANDMRDEFIKHQNKANEMEDEENKVIGQTQSGKKIYNRFDHPKHENFTKTDHEDASLTHGTLRYKSSGSNEKSDKYDYHRTEMFKHEKAGDNLDKKDDIKKSDDSNELQGGKADNLTVEDIAKKHKVEVEFIEDQLKAGMEVEKEHTTDTEEQKEIALDHLSESPTYYIDLAEMEKKEDKVEKGVTEQDEAMKHENKLGAGAEKRKGLTPKDKVATVMCEFKRGTLHSGSGEIVTDKKQALAIAMSEAGIEKDLEVDIEKGGEGSRGGKIIGHTKSGKPIYADSNQNDYGKFSKQEHSEAIKHYTDKKNFKGAIHHELSSGIKDTHNDSKEWREHLYKTYQKYKDTDKDSKSVKKFDHHHASRFMGSGEGYRASEYMKHREKGNSPEESHEHMKKQWKNMTGRDFNE
jgi:hypothetical protein